MLCSPFLYFLLYFYYQDYRQRINIGTKSSCISFSSGFSTITSSVRGNPEAQLVRGFPLLLLFHPFSVDEKKSFSPTFVFLCLHPPQNIDFPSSSSLIASFTPFSSLLCHSFAFFLSLTHKLTCSLSLSTL